MDFESILVTMDYKEVTKEEILGKLPFLVKKFRETRLSKDDKAGHRWIMGNLHKLALGNIPLRELDEQIKL
jgi:glutamyl-tRNA(Gln) amidotransferase subunit E